ncbi:conserved hypothetical protein [Leishmania mexicana MHOM/GT/2001/U1103]|uniref:Uncharacterized protein n=1 Tax=Leishmania mexicana (strain MHOM/GT/2001/U1103) TaxID=929439 RepID=E9AWK5_LEIMU|nr:conserved hypothetical protein [Leishmania mexicana MHOM/GT/2001/U1103]CBZ27341.1 conserved hypothetical protein [Leishmania mexicana MHOM/GT/2001/U1103]
MATLEKQVQSSTLSKQCRADLLNHLAEVETNSRCLSKKMTTLPDANLPSAATMPTDNSVKRGTRAATAGANMERLLHYTTRKQEKDEMIASRITSDTNLSGTYFKGCSHKFVNGARSWSDPFRTSRNRTALSGKDMDFVYRYAEAATGSAIERPQPADDASVAATAAYREGFRQYKGRDPTAKEMEEAGRLVYAFDENGSVGVLQKPHSCYPHTHISAVKTHIRACPNQVYLPEVPPVRAARSEFPGPIPTWSSTKRTITMATNGTYQPGHHQVRSLKREAMSTVVGSR